MTNQLSESLRRYWPTVIATVVVGIIGFWPVLLDPLGRAYVVFCVRYLTGIPFEHHYPPLLVAFVAPVVFTLVVGTGIALLRQVAGQWHLDGVLSSRGYIASGTLQRVASELGVKGQIIVTSDESIYAFCGGLIRPRIYLSRGLLDLLSDEEVEAVVRHELHHVERRDPLRFFACRLVRHLAVLFPMFAQLDDWVRINAELAADRAALTAVPVETLAGALVKVMRVSPTVEYRTIVAALSPTEARVAALLGRPVRVTIDPRDLLVSLGFGLCLIALLTWLAMQSFPLSSICSACPPF